MPRRIITHCSVDLDAVACIVAAREAGHTGALCFVPANVTPPDDAIVLDHPAGEKGRLDADGTRHAAVCAFVEQNNLDWCPRLLAEIDEQDSTGMVKQPRFSLAEILAGLKATNFDDEVCVLMGDIIHGLNYLHRQRQKVISVIQASKNVLVGDSLFLVLPVGPQSPLVGIEANKEGFAGSIYAQGHNLGVTRYPGHDTPDLRLLAPRLPGWFIHSAGFLACWGSRKAPASGPPPKGTPQSRDELAELVLEVFAP